MWIFYVFVLDVCMAGMDSEDEMLRQLQNMNDIFLLTKSKEPPLEDNEVEDLRLGHQDDEWDGIKKSCFLYL